MFATLCESRLAPPIPQDLIIRALALSGKTIEDVSDIKFPIKYELSYPKLFYYLLSPWFLEEYMYYVVDTEATPTALVLSESFWRAIYEYQKGNSAPIVELLTKI
jgi:hypothetical protein